MAIFAKTVPNTHTAAPADYFGPPAGATYAITTLFFCNTTTSDVTIDVWVLDTSSVTIGSTAPPDQYKYLHQLIIPPGDTFTGCLLYTSPSPRDLSTSRMPSSA